MSFYAYAWIASFSSAFIILITKFTAKHAIANPWLFNYLWALIIVVITVPVALFNHAGLPKDWLMLITASLFGTLFYVFYILSMYALDVSTLSPLFNFRTVFAVLVGVSFLGESFTLKQYMLCGLIVMAGIVATIDENFSLRSFFRPSIGIALLAMIFLTLNNVFIKLALVHNSVWTANLWMACISLVLLVPTIPLFVRDVKNLKHKQITPLFGMGIFQTITSYAANIAYGVNVSITSLIMAAPFSMILVWLLSIYVPQLLEKHTNKVYAIRLVAAVIMIASALQLSK